MKAIKMTDDKAWELISQIGWGKVSKDYQALAREWFAKLGAANMDRLHSFVGARVSELWKRVEEYEKETGESLEVGSDDGFSDLRFHIVGLGRAEFLKCMGDPKNMEARHRKGDYKESFDYMFMEPEPPRTEEDKAATLAELLELIGEGNRELQELRNSMDNLQEKLHKLNVLASIVKEDKKSA